MSAHTPAPWELWLDPIDNIYRITHKIPDNRIIVGFVGQKDNAQLIAAAPELLEALKGLLADITEYQTINKLGGENNHWQVRARAAIAKAQS